MLVAAACFVILAQPFACAMPGGNKDKAEKLAAKIEREKNPGKKARLQLRLAKLRLEQADAAYHVREYAKGNTLLQQYFDQVKNSWATLQGTDNGVRKHLGAFKKLEISLRENARFLEDLRHRIPYPQNGFIKQIEEESSTVHNEVLEALFPEGFTRKGRSRPPRAAKGLKTG